MKKVPLMMGLLFAALCTVGLAAPVVSLQPSLHTFQPGDDVVADVLISGLQPGRALGTFDVLIDFDPTLLAFVSASFGNQLDLFGLGDINAVTPSASSVELFELSLESSTDLNNLQLFAFSVATVHFSAIGAAVDSQLRLSIIALGDSSGATLLDGSPGNPVPEPSSVFLALAALSALAVSKNIHLARRKHAA